MARTSRLPVIAGIVAGIAAGSITAAVAANSAGVEPPPRIAFVARSDDGADALAAGPTAGQLGAPIFLTPTGHLVESTAEALKAYRPEVVMIAGGPAAISPEVEAAIAEVTGIPTDRVLRAAGDDRHETAAAISTILSQFNPAYTRVIDAAPLLTQLNRGESATLAKVGPVTFTARCLDDGGAIRGRVEVTSSTGPWFHHGTQYGTSDTLVLESWATPVGAPTSVMLEPVIAVPETGTYVVDFEGRSAMMLAYPGADCRFVGHLAPIDG